MALPMAAAGNQGSPETQSGQVRTPKKDSVDRGRKPRDRKSKGASSCMATQNVVKPRDPLLLAAGELSCLRTGALKTDTLTVGPPLT